MKHTDIGRVAVPGVVDGSLTISLGVDREVSFHVELGSVGSATGRCPHFEFILRSENAAVLRAVLAAESDEAPAFGTWPSSIPCQVGIRIGR